METMFHAVFNKHGFVRATKNPASRKANEIGVRIAVEVPDAAFDDGYIHASIAVPEDAVVLAEVKARVDGGEPMEGAA